MYNILLRIIYLFLSVPFIHSKKYQKWIFEQKKIFQKLNFNKKHSLWIHCSSFGEYQQIKPLIIKLKKNHPLITLTFFSPSGYVNFNDFDLITKILYLPLDTKYNMNLFIKMVNPNMVIISNQ